MLDVSDFMKNRIASAIDALHEAQLGTYRVLDSHNDPVRTHLAHKADYTQYLSRQRQAREHLKALIAQLELGVPHPSGYTPEVLMQTAGIGKSLWQDIRKKAGITIKRGKSNRHFTNREVRTKLIPSAKQHGTRKSIAAAKAWQEMLDEDKRES